MNISEIEKITGISKQAIRFYEKEGLISPKRNQDNQYREYDENDVKTYGGLMKIDGYYYYARTSGEIVVNRTYYTSKTECELPNGSYTFDENGRMVNPPVSNK